MATDTDHHPRTAGPTIRHHPTARRTTAIERAGPWLLLGGYAGLYAAVMLVALVACLTLAASLSGTLGVVSFFTVGLGLIAVVPVVARRLFSHAVTASRR